GRQAVAPPTSGSPAAISDIASHAAAAPLPGYQPPLHGTNPHGEGTATVVDVAPTNTRPLPGDPSGKSNPNSEIIVGRSLGEQRSDGTYHGHVTILSLLGSELLKADSTPGMTDTGPVGGLNSSLDNICNSTGLCLGAATVSSTTTATSSVNSFTTVKAVVGAKALGTLGPNLPATLLASVIGSGASNSEGDIATVGNCQIAHGASSVTNLVALGIVARAVQSTSDTKTCNDGTSVAPVGTSSVAGLGQPSNPLNLSALLGLVPAGCSMGGTPPTSANGAPNGIPNTDGGIPALLPIICNADDTATNQATIPYNVREGLTLMVLSTGNLLGGGTTGGTTGNLLGGLLGGGTTGGSTTGLAGLLGSGGTTGGSNTALAQVTAAASESAATAPPSTTGTTNTTNTTNNTTGTTNTTNTTNNTTGTTNTTNTTNTSGSTGTTGATGTTGTTGTTGATGTTGTTTATAAAHLPFTGYDVTGAVLVGLLLLGCGFAGRQILATRARRNSI
ncbi:MAG: hypothetical protein ACR2QA_11560, partial [Solirubrobacteraceae bacterium]